MACQVYNTIWSANTIFVCRGLRFLRTSGMVILRLFSSLASTGCFQFGILFNVSIIRESYLYFICTCTLWKKQVPCHNWSIYYTRCLKKGQNISLGSISSPATRGGVRWDHWAQWGKQRKVHECWHLALGKQRHVDCKCDYCQSHKRPAQGHYELFRIVQAINFSNWIFWHLNELTSNPL